MDELKGRRALVTGAGMGIGQAIARELARQGAAVAIHYANSAAGATETADGIREHGGTAHVVQGNLGVVADCRRIVDEAVSALGGLDVLVNNGGVTRTADFVAMSEEAYDEVFNINMRGYFFCAQQAVPHLERRGGAGGVIVNISSVHGGGGAARHVAYAATKGAIVAFTRTLAIELAPRHVRVNAVAPGLIEVPRYFDDPSYTRESGNERVPGAGSGCPKTSARRSRSSRATAPSSSPARRSTSTAAPTPAWPSRAPAARNGSRPGARRGLREPNRTPSAGR